MDFALITVENEFMFYFYSKIATVDCGDVILLYLIWLGPFSWGLSKFTRQKCLIWQIVCYRKELFT